MSDTATNEMHDSGSIENPRPGIVFVVDDDAAVRKALSRLFRSAGYAVTTFDSAQPYLDAASPEDAGCLVLDIRMPGMTGLELQDLMSVSGLDIPVVFLSGHADVPVSVRAMKRGAVDFFEKPFDEEELLDAVDRAVKQDADDRERQGDRAEVRLTFDVLTPREFEVMTCMVGGMPNREIAEELQISEKTVKIHRGRVMKKMEARSLAYLMSMAQSAGIEPRRTDAPPTSA